MTLSVFFLLIIAALVFCAMKFAVGNLAFNLFAFRKFSIAEKIILGWAIISYSLYLVERLSLRIDVVWGIYVIFFLAILYSIATFKPSVKARRTFCGFLTISLLSMPVLLIQFAPSVLNGQIFFQNWAPDLDGNLVSIGYLMDGWKHQDLINVFSEIIGSRHWGLSDRPDPWYLVDHRDGIAVEFFLRSIRWGHAIEAKFLNSVFSMPVWFGLMAQMLLSGVLSSWLVFNFAKEKSYNHSYALFVAIIFSLSQTVILMFYEGINVQQIYTPVFLYLIFNIQRLASNDWRDMVAPCAALFILMISFGEGAQIYGVIALLYTMLMLNASTWKNILRNTSVVFAVFLVFFWIPMHDFLSWTFARFNDSHAGGALHYDFSILNLLIPLPYFRPVLAAGVETIDLYLLGNSVNNYLTLLCMTLLVRLLVNKCETRRSLYAVFGVCAIVLYTGHTYALWKVMALLSSFILINLLQKTLSTPSNLKLVFLTIVLVINAVWAARTTNVYSGITTPVMSSQMKVSNLPSSQCYSVLTPSDSRGYFRLGSIGQLKWLNEAHRQFGLRPQFIGEKYKDCEVYVYYDCTIEKQGVCGLKNKPKFSSNTFYQTGVLVNQLVDQRGYLILAKVEELKNRYFFGIKEIE